MKTLWGHEFDELAHSGSLTDRIYQIVAEEIRRGRWKTGDALPLPRDVAQELEISLSTVARAYSRLGDLGIVKRSRRKGTVVKDPQRAEKTSKLRIGILLGAESPLHISRPEVLRRRLLAEAHRIARLGSYRLEVAYLGDEELMISGSRVREIFSEPIEGLIACNPVNFEEPPGYPVVYAYSAEDDNIPKVAIDNSYAMKLLIREAFEAGHRKLLPVASCGVPRFELDRRWLQFATAADSLGLVADEDAFRESASLDSGHLPEFVEFLRKHSEATALLSILSPNIARLFHQAAPFAGRKIPEDLSILSYGEISLADGESIFSGVEINTASYLGESFRLLESLIRSGERPLTAVLVKPDPLEGVTLAPPR